jgi:hypothetical protein
MFSFCSKKKTVDIRTLKPSEVSRYLLSSEAIALSEFLHGYLTSVFGSADKRYPSKEVLRTLLNEWYLNDLPSPEDVEIVRLTSPEDVRYYATLEDCWNGYHSLTTKAVDLLDGYKLFGKVVREDDRVLICDAPAFNTGHSVCFLKQTIDMGSESWTLYVYKP